MKYRHWGNATRIFSKTVWRTFAVVYFLVCLTSEAPAQYEEYEMKAAFLYNFLLYAVWPESEIAGDEGSVIIGILGKDPFGSAFDPVEGRSIDGKTLVVERFGDDAPIDSLMKCAILFIDPSIKNRAVIYLDGLADVPVMTVSEMDGFLEAGGMINLIKIENTIKFEINRMAAERSGIILRSRLLRLAYRIVENDQKAE